MCNMRVRCLPLLLFSAYVLAALAALSTNLNNFACEFVYDDPGAILGNEDVLTPLNWERLLRHDFWGRDLIEPVSHRSFRPITVVSFRLNYLMTGEACSPFRATNIALHVLVTILFMATCHTILGRCWPSFLAATVFAVHPVHCDAINQIVGRAELLCALFFLMAFLSFHACLTSRKPVDAGLHFGCTLVFTICSMLSKESGLSVMALLFVYCFVPGAEEVPLQPLKKTGTALQAARRLFILMYQRKSRLFMSILLMCITVVLSAIRLWWTGPVEVFVSDDNPAAFHSNPLVRFASYHNQYLLHALFLIYPKNLSHDWTFTVKPIESISDIRLLWVVLFWLVILAIVYCALMGWTSCFPRTKACDASRWRRLYGALVTSLAFLVMPFLPSANILVTVGFTLAERVLYIPSMGFALLLAWLVQLSTHFAFEEWRTAGVPSLRLPPMACGFVVVSALLGSSLAFATRAWTRNRDWISHESLLRSAIKTVPQNPKNIYTLGVVYKEKGRWQEAEQLYHRAFSLQPSVEDYAGAIGLVHAQDRQELEKGLKYFQLAKVLAENKGTQFKRHVDHIINLALTQRFLGMHTEALGGYMQLCREDPLNPSVLRNQQEYITLQLELGQQSGEAEDFTTAKSHFSNALELVSCVGTVEGMLQDQAQLKEKWADAWNGVAISHEMEERFDEAEHAYMKGLEIEPDRVDIQDNLNELRGV